MLKIDNLHAYYGKSHVLHGVHFEVQPGEIVALLGRNGAGKTTLLKCLVGLHRPTRGRALAGGQDNAGRDVAAICRLVGYLPQDPNALLFADTVREELLITLRNHGIADLDEILLLHLQFLLANLVGLPLGWRSNEYQIAHRLSSAHVARSCRACGYSLKHVG